MIQKTPAVRTSAEMILLYCLIVLQREMQSPLLDIPGPYANQQKNYRCMLMYGGGLTTSKIRKIKIDTINIYKLNRRCVFFRRFQTHKSQLVKVHLVCSYQDCRFTFEMRKPNPFIATYPCLCFGDAVHQDLVKVVHKARPTSLSGRIGIQQGVFLRCSTVKITLYIQISAQNIKYHILGLEVFKQK